MPAARLKRAESPELDDTEAESRSHEDPKTVFACQECGAQSPKWLGRCPGLRRVELDGRGARRCPTAAAARSRRGKRYAWPRPPGRSFMPTSTRSSPSGCRRGIGEFDRVLGGGVVPGSLVLHRRRAGHRQVHAAAAGGRALRADDRARCSTARARNPSTRSSRAASGSASSARRSTSSPRPVSSASSRRSRASSRRSSSSIRSRPSFRCKFQSAPGSIGQVREAATQLLFAAKGQNIPTFLVGHVTKDGNLAGPKALEHIVDTVLYFEGEKHHAHRVVRAVKNRFGAVSELGVFEMTGTRAPRPCRTRRSCSSPSGPPTRRAPPSCAASRVRARCSSRSRRSSAPARTATRAVWRAGSIRTGCRCSWPCSRNAPAST